MKTSIACKQPEFHTAVDTEFARQLPKIERLLKRYNPDLVQLHGVFDRHPRKAEFSFSLNLSLPTGTIHATGVGPDLRVAIHKVFAEMSTQLKKHQAHLRKDYDWHRARPLGVLKPDAEPAS
jgi:ribosome-associated translation inhibitor RaiA